MQHLTFICLVAIQLAGCIFGGDDGDDAPPSERVITAHWNFELLATNDVFDDCPAGFDTAAVIAHRVDAAAEDRVELYDCAANTGAPIEGGYDPGVYDVVVQIQSRDGASVYGKSLPVELDVSAIDKSFDVTLLEDGGYFTVAWELFDATTTQTLGCADVAPDRIEMTSSSGAESFGDQFACEDVRGLTAGLVQGTYNIELVALDGGGNPLGPVQTLAGQVIGDRNQITDLGTIRLPIN